MSTGFAEKPQEILIFEVGGQRHGLASSHVQELLPVVTLTTLAQAPAPIEGVMNLRGRVVPVLDVRARLRLPPKSLEAGDHLIVARAGERLVALRVDRATELVQLAPDDVEETPHLGTAGTQAGWVAKLSGDLVPVHDLESFLSPADAAALDEAAPDPRPPGEEG